MKLYWIEEEVEMHKALVAVHLDLASRELQVRALLSSAQQWAP